jgi:ribosomal protein L37AE/L43A
MNAGSPREMACPRCSETRLIEQVDASQWFCNVCAHAAGVTHASVASTALLPDRW